MNLLHVLLKCIMRVSSTTGFIGKYNITGLKCITQNFKCMILMESNENKSRVEHQLFLC